ncbi:MAG: flavin reductase [Eubacteriales bacterium]|nr:flavin reductase [Eubacteriales bacterium]
MFTEGKIREEAVNPIHDFGDEWMALAAGNEERGYNVMTVAWGHFGALWERDSHANRLPTVICYVRPGRYTKEFMDREEYFTLTVFPESCKKALGYLGSHSGRDGDKAKAAGLTPVYLENATCFAEGKTVYLCRKLYHAPLVEEGFVDRGLIDFNYPERDFHEMYVGEIVKVLVNDGTGEERQEN